MSDGNGIDIGAVYQLLSEVARTVTGHDRKLDDILERLDGHDQKLDTQDRKLDEIIGVVNAHTVKLDGHDSKLDAHDRKLNEIIVVVNGHTAKLDELAGVVNAHDRKLDDLGAGLADLRETVTHYHSTVLGHGILYSELEERIRRIERHLKLEPAGG